ncbi:hypothetical protein [Caenimonas aquaedulcis]|uniref:Lipoprotein n=1 Tax=Caenimonas aquaedulcis TaxID=2793270 RepID=A0A931H747_9BURK|nr:hypothetical protein [Caenimonas aquaedulcis]MBG9389595.1 hypothetical protein [Caenimonas aquaedulcis]
MQNIKIPALLTALALSCGVAFAQTSAQPQTGSTSDFSIAKGNRVDGTAAKTRADGATMGNKAQDTTASAGTTTASSGDTMTNKARHTAHKAKVHAKKAGHKAKRVAMNESGSDTRSMGASGSDMSGTRQSRMDAAYANWQSKRK